MSKKRRGNPPHGLSVRSSQPRADSLAVLLDRAQRFFMRDQMEQGLAVLEEVPERYRQHPDFLLVRGQAWYVQGQFVNAIDDLESYLKRRAEDTQTYFTLAKVYTEMAWRAHLIQALRRYLAGQKSEIADVIAARELLRLAESDVFSLHTTYGVPKDQCVPASYYNEEAMRALNGRQFEMALRATRRAIQLAPRWPSPYNNRASSLFESGRTDEAIAQTKEVLETIEPDNLFATSNMVIFSVLLDQRETAAIYVERLQQLGPVAVWARSDLEIVIQSLAYWEDGALLWEIAQWVQAEGLIEPLSFQSTYALAAAALNTGHLDSARLYFQSIQNGDVPFPYIERLLNLLKDASGSSVTIPTVSGCLSYIPGVLLLRSAFVGDFLDIMREVDDRLEWPEALARKRDALLRRYPKLEWGVIRFFKDADPYSVDLEYSMNLLVSLGTARAYETLSTFACGKIGPRQARMNALFLLLRAKQFKPGERVMIWDEDIADWHEVALTGFAIKEPDFLPYAEDVLKLLSEALEANRAGDYDRAVALMKQVLALDSHCGPAAYNIGAINMTLGNEAEGRFWIARAAEIEPGYLLAHAALAKLLAREGKTEEALQRLEIFVTQEEVSPHAYTTYQDALFTVAMVKGDFDEAEKILTALEEIFPDETMVHFMRERWEEREVLNTSWSRIHDFLLEGAHRRHERMLATLITPDADARLCLDRLTREDALPAVAKHLSMSVRGRKAELVEAIAEALTSSGTVTQALSRLSDAARAALHVLLEHGGVMPWQAFTVAFGDDFDESPYWIYHEPESIPGILKSFGLLAVGTYKGQQVALIPADLRPLLSSALEDL